MVRISSSSNFHLLSLLFPLAYGQNQKWLQLAALSLGSVLSMVLGREERCLWSEIWNGEEMNGCRGLGDG